MKDKYDSSTDDFLLRFDLTDIETEWSAPTELPDLTNCKTISIDLETRDPEIKTKGPGWATKSGEVIGVAVAAGDFHGYFPIRHQSGPNLDPKMVLRWVDHHMKREDITKVCHNAQYDIGWLRAEGVEVKGKIIDTMLAAAVVDENRWSYGLDALGRDYLGARKDERLLKKAAAQFGVDPKAEMYKLPARYVGGYAEQDAVLTLKLWHHLMSEIDKQDLHAIFDLESRVLPALIDMRSKGVRVDLDGAAQAKRKLSKRYKDLQAFVKDRTGVAVEPWAAESVKQVFEYLALPYPRTQTGQPSFTKDFLKEHPHEVARAINSMRETDKANSTFIENITKFAHKGRIHCEFHQLKSDDGGTVTGRMSCSNPNLQQIPARDPEVKKLIRGLFIPDEGCKWGSFDYSSQEPRMLVHFASQMPPRLRHPMINDIVREYKAGDADLHQMVADMAGITRKQAKTINLGIMYGMGKAKLANQMGMSETEASALLETYHEQVPFVKGIADAASKQAEHQGQIRTIGGRLCRFHLWEPTSFGYNKPMRYEEAQKAYGGMNRLRRAFTYKALNRLIQGSSADQTKTALAVAYESGHMPLLQVHDELCFNVPDEKMAGEVTEIMENCLPLNVPSRVDADIQTNWGDVD